MKYISLIPAILSILFFPASIFAANFNIELLEQSDFYNIKVNISGLEKTSCKDKTCYLQGMFTTTSGAPKYFGYTFGQSDWFPYSSSPDKDFIKTNFVPFETGSEGSWSGIVRLSLNKDDPDYKGSGQYLIKIRRYTGESSSAATDDINQLIISVNDPVSITSAPTVTTTTTPTVLITQTITPKITPTSAPTKLPSSTPTSKLSPAVSSELVIATITEKLEKENPKILGESTDKEVSVSAEINLYTQESSSSTEASLYIPEKNNKSYLYKYLSMSGGLVILISGALLYLRYRGAKIY